MEVSSVKIPALPAVTLQVLKFDPAGETADTHHLAGIIGPDQGICTELMRIANSAYYGRSGSIRNIKDAISLIGLKGTKNVVLLLVSKNFGDDLQGKVYRKYLSEFPVVSALVGQELGRAFGKPELADDLFTLGLLQRIGMTLIGMVKKDHYGLLLEQAESMSIPVREMERDAYRADHIELSRQAFHQWKLPPEFTAVMDNFDFAPAELAAQSDMLQISFLANLLAIGYTSAAALKERPELEDAIFSKFDPDGAVRKKMGPAYFDTIKEHPFYKRAQEES